MGVRVCGRKYLPGSIGVSNEVGVLYVVATPIGNLGDISSRAVDVLSTVDAVLAEDTRHSTRLLNHLNIKTRILALHDHNERAVVTRMVARLEAGETMALISDAGTPLISDPGYLLVRASRERGIKVAPVPGASALLAALSVCGLPTAKFSFEGFLPAASGARRSTLERLQYEDRTLIFFEAPHRIVDCVRDAADIFGADREAVVARELTKSFETILSGRLDELLATIVDDENQRKGEFVLLVSGASDQDASWANSRQTLELLLAELPVKRAVALAAKITGEKKNRLYRAALEIRGELDE